MLCILIDVGVVKEKVYVKMDEIVMNVLKDVCLLISFMIFLY